MKKSFIILIIISLFISLLQAQGKKEKKEIVIKKTEIRQIEVDQIKMGEYILTPKSIEEIVTAGEQLKSYSSNMYSGLIVYYIGSLVAITGSIPDKEGNINATMITLGGLGAIIGSIMQIVTINKIGKAGDHLKKTVQK